MRNVRNSKGFTLIELMIVVVIIGILAAIAIPKFSGAATSAKQAEADGILKQIYTLQEAHFAREGNYGSDIDLVDIGYEAPEATDLKYFQVPAIESTGTAFTACLAPKADVADIQAAAITEERAIGKGATCAAAITAAVPQQ